MNRNFPNECPEILVEWNAPLSSIRCKCIGNNAIIIIIGIAHRVLRKLGRPAKFTVKKVNNMDMKDDIDMSDADSEFKFDMDNAS